MLLGRHHAPPGAMLLEAQQFLRWNAAKGAHLAASAAFHLHFAVNKDPLEQEFSAGVATIFLMLHGCMVAQMLFLLLCAFAAAA